MSISSGYTSRLQLQATNCDKARLLARLQNVEPCAMSFPSNKGAPAASVLERKAATSCGSATDVLSFPKKATSCTAYTKSLETKAILCQPKTYERVFPAVCPLPPPINPAIPAASLAECQPSRFF
jgi:hypothetical protein